MHLSNHTLGLISLQAQETARPWVMALWHSPFGRVLLYGGLLCMPSAALPLLPDGANTECPFGKQLEWCSAYLFRISSLCTS